MRPWEGKSTLGELIAQESSHTYPRRQLCIGFDPRGRLQHGLGDSLGSYSTLANFTLESGARFFFSPVRPNMHDVGDIFADLFGPPDMSIDVFDDVTARLPHAFAACQSFNPAHCKGPGTSLRVTPWQNAKPSAAGEGLGGGGRALEMDMLPLPVKDIFEDIFEKDGLLCHDPGETSRGGDRDRRRRKERRVLAAAAGNPGLSTAAVSATAAASAAAASAVAVKGELGAFDWDSCAGVVFVAPGSTGHGLYYGARHLYVGAAADLLRERYRAAQALRPPPSPPLLPGAEDAISIAVHVRLGDVAEWTASRWGKRIDVSCWQVNALKLVLAAVRADCARVFLFAEAAENHTDIVKIRTSFPELEKEGRMVFMGPEVPARAAFDAMAAADVFVASTSGFSSAARSLHGDGIVIAPGCKKGPPFPARPGAEFVVPCSPLPKEECALFGSAVTGAVRASGVAAIREALRNHSKMPQCGRIEAEGAEGPG